MPCTLHSFSLLLLLIIGFVVVDSSTPLSLIEETRTTHPFMLEDGPIEGCDGRDFELKCKDNNPVIYTPSVPFFCPLVHFEMSQNIVLFLKIKVITNVPIIPLLIY